MSNSAAIARARSLALKNNQSYENLSHENKQKALTYMIDGDVESMKKLIDLYQLGGR